MDLKTGDKLYESSFRGINAITITRVGKKYYYNSNGDKVEKTTLKEHKRFRGVVTYMLYEEAKKQQHTLALNRVSTLISDTLKSRKFAKEQLLEIASILNIDVSTIDFDLTK
jgi:hypothetical protein